jgi:hypothetical protein
MGTTEMIIPDFFPVRRNSQTFFSAGQKRKSRRERFLFHVRIS